MDGFSEVSQIFLHFTLKSREREVKPPCFYYVWWALNINIYCFHLHSKFWTFIIYLLLTFIIFLYLVFQSFDIECTWWKLFQKHVVHTNFDIYVFIVFLYQLNIVFMNNFLLGSEVTGHSRLLLPTPWSPLYWIHTEVLLDNRRRRNITNNSISVHVLWYVYPRV